MTTRCFRCQNILLDHYSPCPVCEGRKNTELITKSNQSVLEGIRAEAQRSSDQRELERLEEKRERDEAARQERLWLMVSQMERLAKDLYKFDRRGQNWFTAHYVSLSIGLGLLLRDRFMRDHWLSTCKKIAARGDNPDNVPLLAAYDELISAYMESLDLKDRWEMAAIAAQDERRKQYGLQCTAAWTLAFGLGTAAAWFLPSWHWFFRGALTAFMAMWGCVTIFGFLKDNPFGRKWPSMSEADVLELRKKNEDHHSVVEILDVQLRHARELFEGPLFGGDEDEIREVLDAWAESPWIFSDVFNEEVQTAQEAASRWRSFFRSHWVYSQS
ncbi:hypothetical protein [uncultured Hydrogenophaga sp.]|uniref:hypothetical protein n=1 Tax=uncultured Hydrogenophaga sp. TaxID=199683 RepID=UPI00265ED59D|nr:hypothetical protein [uncultured Hydrogenophaga sp.]